MSAADLNLSTLELTSTLRTAPLNGQASSSDYNESQRETLVDLTTLVDFINNTLLPLINALPAGALLPSQSPVGIEGRTINSDTSDQSALFFDALTSSPLTIANSLRILDGIVTSMEQQLIDMGVQVAALQAQLASTNQNDIALALQNLSSALNQISIDLQNQNTEITNIIESQIAIQVDGVASSVTNTANLVGSSGIEILDAGGGQLIFSLYVSPEFTSMSNNVGVLEVGSTLSSVTATWSLNKIVTSLSITAADSHLTPNSVPITLAVSATSQVFTGSYTPTGPATATWTFSAGDGTNTGTSSTSVAFEQKNYWGPSSLSSMASSDVLALSGNGFKTSKNQAVTYNCTGGAYPYFVYPSSYGSLTNVTVGGLAFSDFSTTVLSFTNASGYTSNYNVVRFNNLQTGSAIQVVWG